MRRLAIICSWIIAVSGSAVFAGVVKEDYKSRTVFGHTTLGDHKPQEKYKCTNPDMNCEANLVPAKVTYVRGSSTNYAKVLGDAYAGWTFSSAVAELSDDSLVVHTYHVVGSPTLVGAWIDLEYVPHGTDPTSNVHWIQVISDNHNITNNPGHGNLENIVDVASTNTTDPYYDNGFAADGRNFLDFSRRNDGCDDHYWNAELHLVVETGPKEARIYGGVLWGWENHCNPVPEPNSLAALAVGALGLTGLRRGRK